MANPQIQNDPIYSLPFLYINGMVVSNDPTTPNTLLNVSAGQCRDSNDIMDICLGVNTPNIEGGFVPAPLVINSAFVGANGIDVGTLAASTMYAVYMIGDSRYYKPVAAIITLASNAAPIMPFGYDSYRLIGYWTTDGASHFMKGYVSNQVGGLRMFTYDAPMPTAIVAGASAVYAPVVLTGIVPPVNNLPVYIQTDYTAAAAADVLNLKGFSEVGDAVTVVAPVAGATAHTFNVNTVLSQLNVLVPTIDYKVSAGAVAINVTGYAFSI